MIAAAEGIRGRLTFLREINDLKRLHAQNISGGSFASWLFRLACVPICTGAPLQADMWCSAFISGARLGAITPAVMKDVGISQSRRCTILKQAVSAHKTIGDEIIATLSHTCAQYDSDYSESPFPSPDWVERLNVAPRAGATCPGKPRIVLEPPEMHGDHSLLVAVYGYLFSDLYGANREDAWLIGLCHHFHNAYLPDAGFTGETLLGHDLGFVLESLRARVLGTLPELYRSRLIRLFAEIERVETPVAKAFHSADTVDRVLQLEHYENAAQFRVQHAIVDLQLVHEGPTQAFQVELLNAMGLMPEISR